MYYRLRTDWDEYRNYILTKEHNTYYTENVFLDLLDGRSLKEIYKPSKFVMTTKTEKKFPIADIMISDTPICSEKAKKVIETLCNETEVEFFPCTLEDCDETYYLFNIVGSQDCVDYDNSMFMRFASSGKIMFFDHIEFKQPITQNLFRINELKIGHFFVTEEAKEVLESAGLKGLILDNTWFKK